MIVGATVLMLAGFAALASTAYRSPHRPRRGAGLGRRRRRALGWGLLALSLPIAIADDGLTGMLAWLGIVPVCAGLVTLAAAYRPSIGAIAGTVATLIGAVALLSR